MMKKERNNAIMLQCDNAVMLQCRVDRVFALKGQVISAQGNALGWKGTRTPAPWFSASNPVANEGYKSQQVRVNPLQGRVNPLQGSRYSQQVLVATLQGHRYSQQVLVATLQGSRYSQQVRVATLQGSRYFQQGTVSAVPASVSDFLFSENVTYRIRNHQSGNEEASYKLATTYPSLQTRGRKQACQRAAHLTTPVWRNTTLTGLATLSGWTTLSGCGKNEIQFSRSPGLAGTVIHRAQAVRACLLPFTVFFNNN